MSRCVQPSQCISGGGSSRHAHAPAARCAARRPVVLATLLLATLPSAGQELPWTHFTPGHQMIPLPSASVQSVYQDRLGYVWLGLYSAGLARYDGHSMDVFAMADGLPDPTIREVTEDGEGHLWIGSENGLAVSDRPLGWYRPDDRIRFVTQIGGIQLVGTRIRHNWLAADPDGSVWVATPANGLIRYRLDAGHTLQQHSLDLGALRAAEPNAISAIVVRRDGTLWVALENGSVGTLAPGQSELRPVAAHLLPPSPLAVIHEGVSGALWAGCFDGLVCRLDSPDGAGYQAVNHVLSDQIQAILETGDGWLWAGAIGSGAVRLEIAQPQHAAHVTRSHGLPSETIWSIAEDAEDNLWIGHNAGISRLRADHRAFTNFTGTSRSREPALLPEPSVFSVVAPQPGASSPIWAGTGGGLVAIDPAGASSAITVDDGLTSNSVYALRRDWLGRLWIGTLTGLDVLSLTPRHPPPQGALGTRRVRVSGRSAVLASYDLETVYACKLLPMLLDIGGKRTVPSMWICGTAGAACFVQDRWFLFGEAAGVPPAGATNAEADDRGYIWLGSQASGIYRSSQPLTVQRLQQLAGKAWLATGTAVTEGVFSSHWNRARGARSENVHNLEWAGDRMWVATSAGLSAIGGEPPTTVIHLDASTGLGGDRVAGMAEDETTGLLWVTQNAGIAQVDPRTGEVERVVTEKDGLVDNEVWTPSSLAVDARGVVYLSTPSGLSVYRPELDLPNRVPPVPSLRRFDFQEDLAGNNDVVFQYTALSFANELQVRYRTRLVGYDDSWSAPTAETKIRYTNLPAFLVPRAYALELTAANNDGLWSEEPLRFAFKVAPPWWLRWWAIAGYLATFIIGLAAFDLVRTNRLTRRTQQLEELVATRTAEIRTHAREMETLDEIVATINSKLALEEVMQALLEQGLVLIPQAGRGLLLLRDSEAGVFRVSSSVGLEDTRIADLPLSPQAALSTFVDRFEPLAEGVHVGVPDAHGEAADVVGELAPTDSLLTIEMTIAGDLEGLLLLAPVTDLATIHAFDVETLQRYRQHAISALDKARVVGQLEQKRREAAQASAAKSAFLATMSHELRTPLNSIIGFSEILLAKTARETDPRSARFLSNIRSSGQQLLSLINDILDLSKVEAGHMTVELEDVYVPELVEGVCRIMVGLASQRNIELVQDVAPDLPPVRLDGPKLRHVLYNLMTNAVKFSPDTSRVTISGRILDAATSPLATETLELTISDDGIGIPEEEQGRIFDEFYQLDSGPSRRFVGSGLGLALVKRFVEIQGGQVTVSSVHGRGSTFRVTLPADASFAARSPS